MRFIFSSKIGLVSAIISVLLLNIFSPTILVRYFEAARSGEYVRYGKQFAAWLMKFCYGFHRPVIRCIDHDELWSRVTPTLHQAFARSNVHLSNRYVQCALSISASLSYLDLLHFPIIYNYFMDFFCVSIQLFLGVHCGHVHPLRLTSSQIMILRAMNFFISGSLIFWTKKKMKQL